MSSSCSVEREGPSFGVALFAVSGFSWFVESCLCSSGFFARCAVGVYGSSRGSSPCADPVCAASSGAGDKLFEEFSRWGVRGGECLRVRGAIVLLMGLTLRRFAWYGIYVT